MCLSTWHPCTVLIYFRFAAINLDHKSEISGYLDIVQALEEDDTKRSDFLTACLLKLGLEVNTENKEVPSLSRLHLSSAISSDISHFMGSLSEVIKLQDGEEYLQDENDTFHFQKPTAWGFGSLVNALPATADKTTDDTTSDDDKNIDYNKVVKRVIVHDKTPPAGKETPYFNHDAYYGNLKHYRSQKENDQAVFGHYILYGDVVTSTNTMLEKYVQPHNKMCCSLNFAEINSCSIVFLQALRLQRMFRLRVAAAAPIFGYRLLDP